MHLSPLKYAKSVKLDRAHTLIKEGKNASEAGYLVGYNSPSQFSREYKRHFGCAPSVTKVALLLCCIQGLNAGQGPLLALQVPPN